MNILPGLLKKKGIYWPPGQVDRWGSHTPGTGVVIDCANNTTKQVLARPDGQTLTVTSEVYTDTEIEKDGWIWVGDVLEAPDSPSEEHRIQQVQYYNDVDNSEQLWIASI